MSLPRIIFSKLTKNSKLWAKKWEDSDYLIIIFQDWVDHKLKVVININKISIMVIMDFMIMVKTNKISKINNDNVF